MQKKNALITSRDPKGLQAVSIFEAAYNKSGLDNARAQRLNERGGELKSGILKLITELSVSDRYADEVVSSNYTYPTEYKGPEPIKKQIRKIAKIFGLDPTKALEYAKNLPELPEDAEDWFAIPSFEAIARVHFLGVTNPAEQYCRAVQFVLGKIADSRSFSNFREDKITTDHLRIHVRTAEAMKQIAEAQNGSDILIIAAQLGMSHRGRSVRRAHEVFRNGEFGLGSLNICAITLVHPEQLVRDKELDMDCAGDEFAPFAGGAFCSAPYLGFRGGEVRFSTRSVNYFIVSYGSASGFLPQQLNIEQ